MLASGFERTGGVEYTEELYSICVDNLCKLGMKFSESTTRNKEINLENIVLYRGDAKGLTEELDDYNWFCFYNLFGLFVFRDVFAHVCSILKRNKREIRIAYAEPIGHRLIMNSGLFKCKIYKVDHYKSVMWFNVYRSKI